MLKTLHKLGLDSTKPVSVRGVEVAPRDVVAAALPDPATLGDRMRGKTCAGTFVTGTGQGRRAAPDVPLPRGRQRALDARVGAPGRRAPDGAQPGRGARAARRGRLAGRRGARARSRSRRSRSSTCLPTTARRTDSRIGRFLVVSAVATGAEAVEWNLSDLYEGPTTPASSPSSTRRLAAAQAFRERYRGKLGELSAAELNDAVAELERIKSTSTRVETYARLRQAADASDQARGALVQKVRERNTRIETELLFFDLEWSGLDDDGRRACCLPIRRSSATPPCSGRSAATSRTSSDRARGEDLGREERHRRRAPGAASSTSSSPTCASRSTTSTSRSTRRSRGSRG